MKQLNEYTVAELEEELRIRKRIATNAYIDRIHEVVAELEDYARKNSIRVDLDFGANDISLSFDPHMNEWEVW